ncbi:hypothetical protein BH09PLA1_BH09PLA1_35590 [soil metagenome]
MIKSLIILVLLLALCAGAFLSRPKPAEFKPFLKQKMEQDAKSLPGKVWADFQVDRYVESCTITDRLLWVTVEKDGKRVYTGAFNHWFGGEPAPTK